eukprot:3755705-Pleurochrysis_carterae.AAC.1
MVLLTKAFSRGDYGPMLAGQATWPVPLRAVAKCEKKRVLPLLQGVCYTSLPDVMLEAARGRGISSVLEVSDEAG